MRGDSMAVRAGLGGLSISAISLGTWLALARGMYTTATVLLLLAAAGSPQLLMPDGMSPARVGVELVLGAWRGDLLEAGGHQESLEAFFADDVRPGSVVGHFTRPGHAGSERTVRRLGQFTPEGLVFQLRDGGHVLLRLREGRLVGDLVDVGGQLSGAHAGAIDLARLRPGRGLRITTTQALLSSGTPDESR